VIICEVVPARFKNCTAGKTVAGGVTWLERWAGTQPVPVEYHPSGHPTEIEIGSLAA
jgi:hypothetical protein